MITLEGAAIFQLHHSACGVLPHPLQLQLFKHVADVQVGKSLLLLAARRGVEK